MEHSCLDLFTHHLDNGGEFEVRGLSRSPFLSAYVSIRQHIPVSIRQHTSAYVSLFLSAYVSIGIRGTKRTRGGHRAA
jgi:hypothetical protein